jgi:hypothetical protein
VAIVSPNRLRRFVQNPGFGERRCDAVPLTAKIFSLPNSATQSPRDALAGGIGESRRGRMRADDRMRE